jgi:hypothetical protein
MSRSGGPRAMEPFVKVERRSCVRCNHLRRHSLSARSQLRISAPPHREFRGRERSSAAIGRHQEPRIVMANERLRCALCDKGFCVVHDSCLFQRRLHQNPAAQMELGRHYITCRRRPDNQGPQQEHKRFFAKSASKSILAARSSAPSLYSSAFEQATIPVIRRDGMRLFAISKLGCTN